MTARIAGTNGNDLMTVDYARAAALDPAQPDRDAHLLIEGNDGDDSIDLGANYDPSLYRGKLSVTVDGGVGNDNINLSVDGVVGLADGGTGNDTLRGGDYFDVPQTLLGGEGQDTLIATADVASGGGGDDLLVWRHGQPGRGGRQHPVGWPGGGHLLVARRPV